MTFPNKIRAIIAAYPMLDLRSAFYTQAYWKPIVGVPNISAKVIDDHLASLVGRTVTPVTEADPPDRLDLAFSIIQNGRLLDFFGTERTLFPIERLEDGETDLPPLFIYHGREDSAVPAKDSEKFVQKLKEMRPDAEVHLSIQSGDHGFDDGAKISESWLNEGLRLVTRSWLM